MKNIIAKILVIAALFSSTTACSDDWLSLSDPNHETADTFWKTAEQFDQGLSAAYSTWRRPGYFSRWFQILMILRGDEGWSESPNPEFQADANFIISAYNYDRNEGIVLPWQAMYNSLYYVNQVIDNMNAQGYNLFPKAEADKILGQGYFIRGVAFWAIAAIYGKGPVQTSSISNGPIGNQEDLYKQALSDFTKASELLPENWPAVDKGRVTKGGALGMMARINMQLAGLKCHRPWDAANQNTDAAKAYWQAAKKNIEDILALNIYSLCDDWMDNFTEDNENNSESLFEINFKDGLINGKEVGNQRPKFLGLYLSDGSGAWNDGSARDWLLDEFNKEKDKDGNVDMRKFHTLFYYDPAESQTATANYYGKTWLEWCAQEGYQNDQFPHACYWKKYTSVETDNKNEDYSSGANLRILRLADIYLMYAECINELNGDRTTAVEYINKVRRRVNMSDLNPSGFTTYDELLTQIKHERLVELCGECTRWFDLDRWGDIHDQGKVNEIAERDIDFRSYNVGKNHVWIIPNHEINLWEGLTQNPGY
ncbi:RagB/SusD family nutrient uptake outer membrane protein [Hoylesella saccharolytica]|uniref:RagB/SusD family nutrient uptake outer membrane protein n=1 Tax=Hoylesella saccharolytica TaxID=633701 RepID=UPI00046ED179|nr:RagB/SusD family nutrient uptake outer membrane protein [Hoylesella saccharolytica]